MITQLFTTISRAILLGIVFSCSVLQDSYSYIESRNALYRDTYTCNKTLLWSPLQSRSKSLELDEFVVVELTGNILDGSRCCKCKIKPGVVGLYYEEPEKGYVLKLVRILRRQEWYKRQYDTMMRGIGGLLSLGGAALSAYCAASLCNSSIKGKDLYASAGVVIGTIAAVGGIAALYNAYKRYMQIREVHAPQALAELVGRHADEHVMVSNTALDEILAHYMNKDAQPYCLSCLEYDTKRHDHSISIAKYFWGEPSLTERLGESRFLVLNLGARTLEDHNKPTLPDISIALQ